jgi:hypothetical protein
MFKITVAFLPLKNLYKVYITDVKKKTQNTPLVYRVAAINPGL